MLQYLSHTSKPEVQDNKLKVAVLVSGTGRSLEHLVTAASPEFEIVVVGTDRECPALKIAKQYEVPHVKDFAVLHSNPDLLVLAGYLSKFEWTPEWDNKIINIHPSLLPSFGGKGMYGEKVHQAVLDAGVTYSGCTVHFCNTEYDRGPIIIQKSIPVEPQWDAHDLAAKVFTLEIFALNRAIRAYKRALDKKTDDIVKATREEAWKLLFEEKS